MSETRNTQMVKDAYAAFLRGDVNTVLSMLDDSVQWEGAKGGEGVVPTSGLRRGRAAVGEFFSQVAANIDFELFEPQEYVAQGDMVVAIGKYAGKARPTGRAMSGDWAMVFSFRDGKITRFREFSDSAMAVRAFSPAAVTA
jgi:ketosteroid isomerase-like protein